MKKLVLTVFFIASLSACATTGKKIESTDLSSFKVGATTISDVEAKLGPPTSTSSDAQGIQTLHYDYSHSQARAANFIPFAGPFVGGTDTDHQSVALFFNKNNRLTNYTQTSGTQDVNMGQGK